MKVISIVGARPQFIKMAALHRAIIKHSDIQLVIIHTGQHYDPNMSAVFFKEMHIPSPAYNLNFQHPDREKCIDLMNAALIPILKSEEPDWVIVFGDTNSTLAGAHAAKQCNILLAHIEAGLRSYNDEMPEEKNRIETDLLSDLLFAPTASAYEILSKEFHSTNKKIIQVGDIMLDAFNFYSQVSEQSLNIKNLPPFYNLCSLHRQQLIENLELLANVVAALNKINEITPIIFCAHPRTFQTLQRLSVPVTFRIIEPQGYLSMLYLLTHCNMVITDSGGLQKDAYFAHKNCLTIREETEWTELVNAGVNILAGYEEENIVSNYHILNETQKSFDNEFYGNGNTGDIIITSLINYLT